MTTQHVEKYLDATIPAAERVADLLSRMTVEEKVGQMMQLDARDDLDQLVLELDIHMQIEDSLYYPAVATASPLVAVAHAEHREVSDRLAAALRCDAHSDMFAVEWQAFTTTLHHHAAEEERDMFPQARLIGQVELDAVGAAMAAMLTRLRRSALTRWRIRVKTTVLRRL